MPRRHRIRAVLVAVVALVAALLVIPTVGASAATATLSGVVTDLATGQPISGACVEVDDQSGIFVTSICTDDAGAWRVSGLTSGALYEVGVQADDYASQWWKHKYSSNDAQNVAAPAVLNFALSPTGDLTGTLLNADGSVPQDASITASLVGEVNAQFQGSIDTGTGAFDISAPPGTYVLEAFSGPFDLFAPGVTTRGLAQTFTVTAQQTTSAPTFVLPTPITVSGTVTSAVTGQPLSGICVNVFAAHTLDDANGSGSCTADDGTYQVELAKPGRYQVAFQDPNATYAFQFYPHTVSLGPTTVLTLTAGSAHPGVDAALQPGSVITGRAVDSVTHQPLKDACGLAYLARTTTYPIGGGGKCSAANGYFTITGLAARSYTVSANVRYTTGWAPSSATQAGARLYSPKVGQTLRIGDVQVPPGGTVSGLVTDAATGQPLPDIIVGLGYSPREGDGGVFSTTTDATGHYTLPALPAGPQSLVAWTFDTSYAPDWYGGAPDPSQGTKVTVVDGGSATANFALRAGGTISGTLVDSNGQPVKTSYVLDAYSVATPGQDLGISSDVNHGVFSISGLPQTPVVLNFVDPRNQRISFYYNGSGSLAGATPVTAQPGATTVITAHLP